MRCSDAGSRGKLRAVRRLISAGASATLLLVGLDASARVGAPVDRDVAMELSGPVRTGEHVVIPRFALDDGSTVSLDLEAFEVFAPGAVIIEYSDKGPRRLAPPADRYFRGSVLGDLDSLVVLANGPSLRGFIFTAGKAYAVAPEQNVYTAGDSGLATRVRRIDPERDRPAGMQPFSCGLDALPESPIESRDATALAAPTTVGPMFTSTVYTVNLALETDYELYQLFGSTDGEVRFIGDLTAAASAIYLRDVGTAFQIGTVHLYLELDQPVERYLLGNRRSALRARGLLARELRVSLADDRAHAQRQEPGRRHRVAWRPVHG